MMPKEIERKFLIKGDFKEFAIENYSIVQGFLSTIPQRTVRVRIQDHQGFLTVKGEGNDAGTTRFEWEKEISKIEAESLLTLCEPVHIEKVRYIIPANENSLFEKPNWLKEEVIGQVKYYNVMLSRKPFSIWKK